MLSDVVAQTESLTFSFARRLGRQSDVLAGRASTRRDEGCYPCEGVFVIFSFDCDAGFWDSVPCVMKNNDFVFSFSPICRFQFLICNGGEEIEREKRNSAI